MDFMVNGGYTRRRARGSSRRFGNLVQAAVQAETEFGEREDSFVSIFLRLRAVHHDWMAFKTLKNLINMYALCCEFFNLLRVFYRATHAQ